MMTDEEDAEQSKDTEEVVRSQVNNLNTFNSLKEEMEQAKTFIRKHSVKLFCFSIYSLFSPFSGLKTRAS